MVCLQQSLLAGGPPGPVGSAVDRIDLDAHSWIDVSRNWWSGADDLFDGLRSASRWQQGDRPMYGRIVVDPRLSCPERHIRDDTPLRQIHAMRAVLDDRYAASFGPAFLNYYRDGTDSVAPHGDRELRDLDDTLVAIVTLGAPRPFLVRRAAGGRSIDLRPASGDLIVMGGRCQADWLHGVPKVASAGPRISVSMRALRRPDDGHT